jgi:hypothetical protein
MMQAAEPTMAVAANSEADTSTTTPEDREKSEKKSLLCFLDDKMACFHFRSMPGPSRGSILPTLLYFFPID